MVQTRILLACLTGLVPVAAQAEDGPLFAGIDLAAGLAAGTSSTTNGGAAFAGGGVVNNIGFDPALGLGGHLGYRFDPAWTGQLRYSHTRGGVRWDADFTLIGATSQFAGTASSDVIMGQVNHDWALSPSTALTTGLGLGVSFNTLSGVVETDQGTGTFLSDVEHHTMINPAAQLQLGLEHTLAPGAILGLEAGVAYAGAFETGATRRGNLGVTSIQPYRLDHVWRASLGASFKVSF